MLVKVLNYFVFFLSSIFWFIFERLFFILSLSEEAPSIVNIDQHEEGCLRKFIKAYLSRSAFVQVHPAPGLSEPSISEEKDRQIKPYQCLVLECTKNFHRIRVGVF